MSWILLPLIMIGYAGAVSIPVLALNDKGEFIEGKIEDRDYVESLRIMKETMDQEVLPRIQQETSQARWQLSKFTLGLGLTGEIGAGPFKYSGAVKQRFVYSR